MLPRSRSLSRARRSVRRSGVVTVISALALAASLLVAPTGAAAAVTPRTDITSAAPAADAGIVKAAAVVGFNPELIISDALFYDGNAMSAAEIQAFLNAKIGTCQNGKCLNVLTTGISSRGAVVSQTTGNLICSAIQGGTMPVSELIYRVQVACGISAKVILTTLQKEQGLTTSTAPSDWNLKAAMGASCPDTAPCDPAFAGVGPQILKGTQQLKTYKAANFAKQPGVNFIGYNPNSACGGTNLNIRNYATAALYNYTPYQPNAAALAAGYGLGDSCSSYGNRNFYNYYTAWFGATNVAVDGPIKAYWDANGGSAGAIGGPIAAAVTSSVNGGGTYQNFQNAVIVVSGGSVSHLTYNSLIYQHYIQWGAHNGTLGWPRTSEDCTLRKGQCFAVFSNGVLGWTAASGVNSVVGRSWSAYLDGGGPTSELGIPVGPGTRASGVSGDGTINPLSGGTVYTPDRDGASASTLTAGSMIHATYAGAGGPSGALGWPSARETCDSTGCRVQFDQGVLSWTAKDGVFSLDHGTFLAYQAMGGVTGDRGTPTAPASRVEGPGGAGIVQQFSTGVGYRGDGLDAATFRADDPIGAAYRSAGGPTGRLGWPRSAHVCASAGCTVDFQSGMIAWSASSGVQEVAPASVGFVRANGGPTTQLGVPIESPVPSTANGGGYTQKFSGGLVTRTSSGQDAFLTNGSIIRDQWVRDGAQSGALGWPMSAETCLGGVCSADFTSGSLGWTASSGVQSITGMRFSAYKAAGGRANFGVPLGPEQSTRGGSVQDFGRATAFTIGSTVTFQMKDSLIQQLYQSSGGPGGTLGWPTSFESCLSGYCATVYQGGVIGWSATRGVIATSVKAGQPTGAAVTTRSPQGTSGVTVPLSRGVAYVTGRTSLAEFYSDSIIHLAYTGAGGPSGKLGWPVDTERCTNAGCAATFEGGQITWTSHDGVTVTVNP